MNCVNYAIFVAMKTKTSASKMCVLLAIIFFINPVIASADALFSNLNSTDLAMSTEQLVSELPSPMPCHEDKNTSVIDNKKMNHSGITADCCADICQCDDSGCHASSLVFQSKSPLIYSVNQDH